MTSGYTWITITSSTGSSTTYVAGDGAYAFDSVPAGTYYLRVSSSGRNVLDQWYGGGTDQASAKPIVVRSGKATTGVNLTLSRAGSISGVLATTKGSPVSGASLELYRKGVTSWEYFAWERSADDGSFLIDGLAPGDYKLSFSPPSDQNLLEEWWNDKPSLASATPITVGKGQAVTGLKPQLSIGAVVTGTVAYADKSPVANIPVTAYDRAGSVLSRGYTDGSGRYVLRGLNSGSVAVAAVTPGGIVYSGGASSLTAAAFRSVKTGSQTTIDIGVAGVTVRGRVTVAGTSTALTAGTVVLTNAAGAQGSGVPIGSDGTYSVRGVTPGDYVALVTPSSRSYTPTWSDRATTKEEADYFRVSTTAVAKNLSVLASGAVTGRFGESNVLSLYRWSPAEVSYVSGTWVSAGSTFTFDGLAPGEYTVGTGKYYLGGTVDAASATHFTVASGKTVSLGDVDLKPKNGGAIRGSVTVPAGGYVSVSAYDSAGRSYYTSTSGTTYSFESLPPGQYTIAARVDGYPTAWFGGRKATKVSVTKGSSRTADITVVAADASLSGKVSLAKGGAGVSGAAVTLEEIVSAKTSLWIDYVSSSPGGAYSFGDILQSGRSYRLSVAAAGTAKQSVTFTATSGAVTKNFSLDALGALVGTVSDRGTGKSVANLPVRALLDGTTGEEYSTVTDATGSYQFTQLRAGTYRVQLGSLSSGYSLPANISGYGQSAAAYYAPEWLDDSVTREAATPVKVNAGGKTTAKAGAVERGATVTGRVSGKTSSGARVWLDDATVSLYTLRGQLAVRTQSGGTSPGSYVVSVRSGTYKVCASPSTTGPYAKLAPVCRREKITVRAGQVLNSADVALTTTASSPRSRPTP